MNLKELKSMIAEEYKSYMDEQAANAPAVTTDPGDVDAGGDENPEETLRDIYDMLKDYFEGDDKPAGDVPGDKDGDGDVDTDDMKADADDEEGDEAEALQERFKKLANIIKG